METFRTNKSKCNKIGHFPFNLMVTSYTLTSRQIIKYVPTISIIYVPLNYLMQFLPLFNDYRVSVLAGIIRTNPSGGVEEGFL